MRTPMPSPNGTNLANRFINDGAYDDQDRFRRLGKDMQMNSGITSNEERPAHLRSKKENEMSNDDNTMYLDMVFEYLTTSISAKDLADFMTRLAPFSPGPSKAKDEDTDKLIPGQDRIASDEVARIRRTLASDTTGFASRWGEKAANRIKVLG